MGMQIEACLERGYTAGIITEGDVALLVDMMETLYNEVYAYQEGAMNYAEQLKLKGINLKYPELHAQTERAFKQGAHKILGLWEQGYTHEQVKAMLAQEAAESERQHPTTT